MSFEKQIDICHHPPPPAGVLRLKHLPWQLRLGKEGRGITSELTHTGKDEMPDGGGGEGREHRGYM